jgi:NAD(P)-dependent dehydrogenase (short-subunit alcohol dehydrogenase family)
VLITGASTGLGRQMALTLARAGARVALSARSVDKIEALAGEIAAFDGRAMPFALDVRDVGAIRDVVDAVETELGPINVLVNNAGVSVAKRPEDYTEEDYDFVVETNMKGPWFLAQSVGKRMIQHGHGGKIINIASLLAIRPLGQLTLYGMTKAAITQMTKQLALEWARHNIQVNAICPGYIETEMNRAVWQSPGGEKLLAKFVNRRVGTADVLDGTLLLLASSQSDFMTGAIIPVDDGQSLG